MDKKIVNRIITKFEYLCDKYDDVNNRDLIKKLMKGYIWALEDEGDLTLDDVALIFNDLEDWADEY